MDSPIWSNDLLYLQELLLIIAVTIVITVFCFRVSSRADRRRAIRMAEATEKLPGDEARAPIPHP